MHKHQWKSEETETLKDGRVKKLWSCPCKMWRGRIVPVKEAE